MDNIVLEVKNITKDYGDFKLDNVSFSVPRGTVCGFIGQNGAGKTTTIQLILDAITRDSGEIILFGQEVIPGRSHTLREDIGVVFDEMGFHEFLTPAQLDEIMKRIYKNWNSETYFGYLKRFSLPSKKRCGNFSRGMRMKLQIAVALSHGARFLIMDEPTSGLDPISREELLDIFKALRDAGVSIFFSTHITSDLDKCADGITYIKGGRILASEPMAQYVARCKADGIGGNLEEIMLHYEKKEFSFGAGDGKED